jgi:diguanylate cyclase (GGDEF)-like protein/PAS domain S-box-containing protein
MARGPGRADDGAVQSNPELRPQSAPDALRILLLEDDATFAGLVQDVLRKGAWSDLQVQHAPALAKALEWLSRQEFDLIITDLDLPDSKGLDTLRALARRSDRLICVLTGERDEGLRESALALGAYDLLSKDNIEREQLDRLIRLALLQAKSVRSVRRSEARLRAIVEAEPECVKLLDAEGRLLEMNPAGLRMIEADAIDPLRGQCVFNLVAPEHRAAFAALTSRVAEGMPGTLQFEVIGLKGGRRWLETHAVPLREAGSAPLVLGITRDITARKEAEEEARRLDRMQRALTGANEVILKARSEEELFSRACEIAVEAGDFLLGSVFRLDSDGGLTRVAAKGVAAGQPEPQRPSLDATKPEGRGLIGQACRARSPVISNDYDSDTRARTVRSLRRYPVGSVAVFPIFANGELAGVFGLQHARPQAFTEELTALLGRVAENISFALGNFRREAQRTRLAQMLQLEHAVTRCLAGAESTIAGVREALRAICQAHDWSVGRYWRVDPARNVLCYGATWSPMLEDEARSEAEAVNVTFQRGMGLAGRVWASGEALWVANTANDPRVMRANVTTADGMRGAFLFPVLADGRTIGVLSFASRSVREPDARLLQAVRVIGAQIGQFVQRKEAEAGLRRFRLAMDLSADMITLVDCETMRFVDVNDAACTGTGWTREELRVRGPQDIAPLGEKALREQYLQVIAGGVPARLMGTLRRKDGAVVPVEISRRAVQSEGRWLMVAILRDIGERAREQRLLDLEHSVYRDLSEARPVPEALHAVLAAICTAEQWDCARYFHLDEPAASMDFLEGYAAPAMDGFLAGSRGLSFRRGEGLVGLVWERGEPLWSSDAPNDPRVANQGLAKGAGVHGTLVVPVAFGGRVIGVLSISSARRREPDPRLLRTLRVIGTQIAQFLLRRERAAELERFRTAIDGAADLILLVDLHDGAKLLDMNETMCDELGYRREELVGKSSGLIVADIDEQALRATHDALLARPQRTDLVVRRYRRRDGSTFEVEVLRRVVDSPEGPILVLNARDLTERRRIEERQAAHLRYQEAVAHFGQRALEKLDAAELVAEAVRSVQDGLGVQEALQVEHAGGGKLVLSGEGALEALGPEEARFLAAASSVLSAGLRRVESEQRLAFLAQFDLLTGLPNRALLHDRFTQMIAQAQRREAPLGLLFIDLDDFKLVNDTLGHAAGDELLKEVAQRLLAAVRPGDTVARISGDEFAVILGDLAKPEDAALVAQKVIERLGRPLEVAGQEVFVSASIGIAAFPADGRDAEALLAAADAAMYRAKQAGSNGYQFFTSDINQRTRARAQLGSELRRALEREEFELVYQPKIDLKTGRTCAAEALLRWRHPERGMVAPAEFIPVLEETGLIVPVGERVLRRACADLNAWSVAGLRPVPVAVNLSARQFRQQDLHGRILDLLRGAGVAPALLEVEITESQLMQDPEHAERVMHALHAAGIRVAIDDFGTGYSSLSYLTRFPLSALKIDRSFVADVLEDQADAAIVRAIIDMAHTLGFIVVAEGVETAAQAALLRSLGCEQAQGYHFARPMPEAAFRALLPAA